MFHILEGWSGRFARKRSNGGIIMKKLIAILGAFALVVAVSTAAIAADNVCQQRKADIVDVAPKKDIVNTITECDAAKKAAADYLSKNQ